MSTAVIDAFERMGARAQTAVFSFRATGGGRNWNGRPRESRSSAEPVQVNVLRDGLGEYFDILRRHDVRLSVSDVVPKDRHLVLRATEPRSDSSTASAFLCGHDERAWFVAAVPEQARARTVQEAKNALKPKEVWDAMKEFGVPMEERDLRQTAAFVRQGEWFFVPSPDMEVDWNEVVYHEPIQRGAGKPHRCEAMFRREGVLVHVSEAYPNGLTSAEFQALPATERRRCHWEERTRDAEVFVRGRIRHRDHATVMLPFWHKVVMNTETQARAMRHVAFLD